ncbi:MAG: SIMPL domain-containing protein [Flavobacteriaceae bacterium]
MPIMVVLRTGLIALLSLFAVLAARNAMAQEAPHPQISLTGEASVTAAPDMATVTTGVVTQAKTAAEALEQNTAAMEKITDAMKKAGIESRDLQTSGFSVEPVYTRPSASSSSGDQEAPRIDAYRVRNMLTVRVRDLGALGGVLDRAVSLGSNQISGISFDVENKGALLDKARKEAVADAMRRAEILSTAAGTRLGRVLTINENSHYQPPRPMMMREASMAADKAVPIEAGELELSVTVSVTWELVQ